MVGPGKYDDLCTYVREQTKAQVVLVIILGGEKGDGFSCQGDSYAMGLVPDLLDTVARGVRSDMHIVSVANSQ